MNSLVMLIVLVPSVVSHYTMYDWHAMPEDLKFSEANVTACEDAEILSYHIHVLYWYKNADHTSSALALRDKFINHFHLNGINCTIMTGDPAPGHKMCTYFVDYTAGGPFTTAQYSFFIPVNRFTETSAWMIQNRGMHDLFMHPNTGCEINDHTQWSTWSGKVWPLDMSDLECNYPGCVPSCC